MSDIRFDGRVAIITGGGGSLGRTYAKLLASRGAKLVVNDLGSSTAGVGENASAADKVVAEIKADGGEAIANYDSVTEGEKVIAAALNAFGRVDILINNAGILRDVSFHKMTDEDWSSVLSVHLQGAYSMTKAIWPHLRDQGYGRGVMTTSAAGLYGNFGQANYSAAKLALVGLGQTLAFEGDKRNVKVNIIAPIAGSRMTETILPKEICEKLRPEYVAPLVAYLCSEDVPVTGATFEVGAGVFARVQWLRAPGATISLSGGIAIEDVRENWVKINDMHDGKIITSLQESSMITMANLASAQ